MKRISIFIALIIITQGCVYHGLPEPVDCSVNPVIVQLVSVEDTDCGLSAGSLEVTASGGSGAYNFQLGDGEGQGSSFFSGLGAGEYEVIATDDNNCSGTLEVIVRNNEGMNLSFETTESSCGGNNGSITVVAEGGVPPYSFRMNNSAFQSNNTFSSLAHGEYEISARDATGCEISQKLRVRSGISFSARVAPIIEANCAITGCHSGSQFPDFRSFKNIQDNAALIKTQVVTRTMPIDGTLAQTQINDIVCWVDDGAPNN